METKTSKNDKKDKISRRGFLRSTLATLALPFLSIERMVQANPISKGEESIPTYKTGRLEGHLLTRYYSLYTGIEGLVPAEVSIDFRKQLDQLWQRKMERTSNSVVRQAYNERVLEYLNPNFKPTKMSIEQYLGRIKCSMKDIQDNIDWGKVAELKKLDSRRQKLLKGISLSLNERDFLAYALTELMPNNGETNIAVLDFLLRSAGTEYINLIPALGDNLTSLGPYQWTSYAVYDNGAEKRGASIVNQALTSRRIPGSVIYLEGDDHHKSAYLFAINNIADLLNSVNSTQLSVLEENWQNNIGGIAEYIATAHHGPVGARNIAERWIDNSMRYDYLVSCHGRFCDYTKKTVANRKALESIETDMGIGTIFVNDDKNKKRTEQQTLQERPVKSGGDFIYAGEYKSPRGWNGVSFRYTIAEEDIGNTPKETAIKIADRFKRQNGGNVGWGNIKTSPDGQYVYKLPKNLDPTNIVYVVARLN